jgi:small nuclear ribonucleoprotein (snRNP)-like protein
MASLNALLGARICITSDNGETYTGDLFAYDEKSHTVVIATQAQHDQQHAALKMIRETAIKDLQVRMPSLFDRFPQPHTLSAHSTWALARPLFSQKVHCLRLMRRNCMLEKNTP